MGRLRSAPPPLGEERAVWANGLDVGGMDEVGRGAWAGPLTVAVVVPPRNLRLAGVRDSKQLSPARRAALVPRIQEWAEAWGIGEATPQECDRLGMSDAQRLAARRALEALPRRPEVVLADGRWDFVGGARMLVKGDQRSLAIAAASVLAKEHRDAHMRSLATRIPWFAFEANKGYPSPEHRAGLAMMGPCTEHRTSWSWVHDLPWRVEARGQGTFPGL